jgi:peptidoglycan/LPS O-acetylase OafA/YrhL
MLNWLPTPHEGLGFDVIIVPQAWTLSVELQLYLAAALLFPWRVWGIITALALGAVLRTVLYFCGCVAAPYGIMLVLNVLVFFALGGAAYLAYTVVQKSSLSRNSCIAFAVLTAMAAYSYYYDGFQSPMAADSSDWRFLPLYGMTALLVPFLFAVTKDIKIDQLIGELSYPTYLVHVAVIDLANHINFSQYGANVAHYGQASFILGVTLVVAATMYFVIDRNLNAFRQRWQWRKTPPLSAVEALPEASAPFALAA